MLLKREPGGNGTRVTYILNSWGVCMPDPIHLPDVKLPRTHLPPILHYIYRCCFDVDKTPSYHTRVHLGRSGRMSHMLLYNLFQTISASHIYWKLNWKREWMPALIQVNVVKHKDFIVSLLCCLLLLKRPLQKLQMTNS